MPQFIYTMHKVRKVATRTQKLAAVGAVAVAVCAVAVSLFLVLRDTVAFLAPIVSRVREGEPARLPQLDRIFGSHSAQPGSHR